MTECEELFPQWFCARVILTEYVNGIRGWKVTRGHRKAMQISLDSSIYIAIPEAEHPLVYRLIAGTVSGCLPDLSGFLGRPNDSVAEQSMLWHLNDHMATLVQHGEPDLRSRIAEALGIRGIRFSVLEPLVPTRTSTALPRAARPSEGLMQRRSASRNDSFGKGSSIQHDRQNQPRRSGNFGSGLSIPRDGAVFFWEYAEEFYWEYAEEAAFFRLRGGSGLRNGSRTIAQRHEAATRDLRADCDG
jgi:hypothetical protein